MQVPSETFLTPEQEAVKQELMVKLMHVMDSTVKTHYNLFDGRTLFDLLSSCLIMFSREILVRLTSNSTRPDLNKKIIDLILTMIQQSVIEELESNKGTVQ